MQDGHITIHHIVDHHCWSQVLIVQSTTVQHATSAEKEVTKSSKRITFQKLFNSMVAP